MRIDRIELRLVCLPLVHVFETSFGRVHDRAFILVRLLAGGLEAWGECVAEETPYYSSETTETAWHVITGFLGPRLLALDVEHPRQVFPAFRAVRGHNMAKAALEMAAWDLPGESRRPAAVAPVGWSTHAHRFRCLGRHPGLARRSGGDYPKRNWTPAIGG